MIASILMTLPEEILGTAALLLMLVAAWGGTGSTRLSSWVSGAVLIGAGIARFGAASSGGDAYDGLYHADAFAAFAKVPIYVAAGVSILLAPTILQRSAGDRLTLYVGLELQSLAAYVLASVMRRDTRSAEAGLKYFVLGALASGILLYGISLVYCFSGTTLFSSIATAYGAGLSMGLTFGLVVVFAGRAFKISAVPFHMWTPDVYEGAPTPVTAFFASAPKVAAMAMAVRVAVEAMGPATDQWRLVVIFASL